ncbi:nidogen-like domain-containing protein [Silvimonas iriomotensis]|uniref:PEP-CTERM protein-sorting domain-containing protein n=1 Tax=Silvimonas iriomotensis TaxID=449662 RepID=A0ABQ2PD91_9NEIS|nr:nidogen-like domain-containing protein [Silvimonas iriomotensis]GGP23372.1 hypothetical protein GCM10010970_33720 [Silvimonas iriomotensis]
MLHTRIAIAAATALTLSTVAHATVTTLPDSALTPSTSYYTNNLGTDTLAPNDDESTGQINLGFNFTLYGATYDSLYINNNGNVTFLSPLSQFTPSGPTGVSVPVISPYFADVDTNGTGSVHYRLESDALYVTWDQVGYFGAHTDKVDSFQLVLRANGSTVPTGEGQIGFFYKDMGWTTGDASGGSGGFGGSPAAVGFGDGGGNAQVLASSQADDINQVVANSHIWFNVGNGGVVVVPPTSPVPEPETWALMGMGMVGLIGAAARKRRSGKPAMPDQLAAA